MQKVELRDSINDTIEDTFSLSLFLAHSSFSM